MVRFASPIFTMEGMQPEPPTTQQSIYHPPVDQTHASQFTQSIPSVLTGSGQCPIPSQVPITDNRPIYFSDGVLYANELQQTSDVTTNEENETLPENLVEVYNHLGIVGKLLTSGSLVTIRLLQLCRNLSETLVDALGIARPKYEGEVKAYEEMKQEEAQQQAEVQQLYAGWQPPVPPAPPVQMTPGFHGSNNVYEYPMASAVPYPPPTEMSIAPPSSIPATSTPVTAYAMSTESSTMAAYTMPPQMVPEVPPPQPPPTTLYSEPPPIAPPPPAVLPQ